MKDTVYSKEVGKLFKDYRLSADLSQGFVSKQLGYSSPQFLSNFERGLCMLPLPKLKKALDLYSVDGSEVVTLMIDLQADYLKKTFLKKGAKALKASKVSKSKKKS
jgi:transcriptional regulator with XRE-family HTH domain